MSYQAIEQHEDPEDQDKEQSSFNTVKYYIFGLLSIPLILYLFIYLPTTGPEKIKLPKLIKYDTLSFNLDPLPSSVAIDQLSSHEKYETSNEIHARFETHTSENFKRMILIGDVHGSFVPLQNLLAKLNYTKNEDSLILLGDYLSKGPDSLKVLDYAMSESFLGVLGNHELSILAKYTGSKTLPFNDEDQYTMETKIIKNGKFDKELYIARKLTPEHVEYITSMPLILDLGPVPVQNPRGHFMNPINGVASHLGLLANQPVTNQSISDLLNIDKDWYEEYNEYEKTISKKNRNVVYYGHHASVGLNLEKYTKGLDSGCVYGGELTAMVVWVEKVQAGGVVYKQELVSVECN